MVVAVLSQILEDQAWPAGVEDRPVVAAKLQEVPAAEAALNYYQILHLRSLRQQ